jgi:putative ABC transport system permease protein
MSARWKRYVRQHLPSVDISAEREAEIVDELALQLEAVYEAARDRGLTDADARTLAESEVRDWPQLARTLSRVERPFASRAPAPLRVSTSRPAVGTVQGGFMTGFVQDIRYAVRAVTRAPGFAAVAVTSLALGIGATTIVYSLVDGILLKPLPIAAPERVMLARELNPRGNEISVSWPSFLDWQARTTSFESLAAWRGLPANFTSGDRPRRIMTRQVTWNLFDVLGVRPILGRGFTVDDDRAGGERVALVSFGFWQRELGASPAAIGRRITLDDAPVTVVGVLPAEFAVARIEDAFLPFGNFLTPGSFHFLRGNHVGLAAIGRLAPEATVESARAELITIAAQLAQEHPNSNSGISATVRPLFEVLVSTSRPTLMVLLGSVVAMLLIACANIASLMLARASERAQELAVRRALGAAGWRIGRQLLTESVLLALVGGAAGMLLAWAGFGAVVHLIPPDQPRLHSVELDTRALAVAAGASILTGVLFGILPALQGATGRSLTLLRSARVTGAGATRTTTRRALLLVEVAAALILLAGAGLMVRTMSNLLAIDPGFTSDGLMTAQISLPTPQYTPERRRAFYDAVLEQIRAIPGVQAAAFSISLPVQGSNWNSVFVVSDQPVPPRADLPSAAMTTVTPGYHDTMNIRLLQGRLLQASDGPDAQSVVVVNETFARRFWPGGDVLGRRMKQGWPEDKTPWREIVGVVADVKTGGLDQPAALQVYIPMAQTPSTGVALIARTAADPGRLGSAIEAAIHAVDPALPVYDIQTMNAVIGNGVGQQRLTTVFLLGFAALALVMAAIGVFGVTAYTVSQRTHELGVRAALGAGRGQLLRLVMRQELSASAAGVIVGLLGALGLASLLQSLLYGVPPRDPMTLAAVSLLLLAVTATAAYLPARRATRIDPAVTLRGE